MLEFQPKLGHGIKDDLEVTAWVDDRSLLSDIAPHEGAVLLKRGDGNGVVVKHGGAWNANGMGFCDGAQKKTRTRIVNLCRVRTRWSNADVMK